MERTTIADIAAAADVPSGNVYYYFKTKDDIVAAVVSTRIGGIEAIYADLARTVRHTGRSTQGNVQIAFGASQNHFQRGCPIGSLCTELSKSVTGPEPKSAKLMQALIDGAEQQFKEMGPTMLMSSPSR